MVQHPVQEKAGPSPFPRRSGARVANELPRLERENAYGEEDAGILIVVCVNADMGRVSRGASNQPCTARYFAAYEGTLAFRGLRLRRTLRKPDPALPR